MSRVAERTKADRTASGKAVQTRQRILDAAASVFAAQGFKATSLNDIAAAASMKSGSLYFHFESKDALLAEVLREGIARSLRIVKEAVDALVPGSSARERLCAAIAAHMDALRSLASYAAAVLRIVEEVSPEVRTSFQSRERGYAEYWNGLIANAQREGCFDPQADPRRIRRILFGAMNASTSGQPTTHPDDEMKRVLLRVFGLQT